MAESRPVSRSGLLEDLKRRAEAVDQACKRSNEMECAFVEKKVLNREANEALDDFRRKRGQFGEYLLQRSDEILAALSEKLEPVLCDSATAVCSICQEPVEQHRDIESVRSAEPRSIAVLRGVSNLLRRCLTRGLLRAETEAMLLDIEAALAVAPTSSDSLTNSPGAAFDHGPAAARGTNAAPQRIVEEVGAPPPAAVAAPHDWQPDGGVLRFESHPHAWTPHVHTTCSKCGARAWFLEFQWDALAKDCAASASGTQECLEETEKIMKDAAHWIGFLENADHGHRISARGQLERDIAVRIFKYFEARAEGTSA